MQTGLIQKLKLLRAMPWYHRDYLFRMNLSWHAPWITNAYEAYLRYKWAAVPEAKEEQSMDPARCFVVGTPNVRVGIGHTLSEYAAGVVWSQGTGATYAHCPLPESWEEMLNLSASTIGVIDLMQRGIRRYKLPRMASHPNELDFDSIRRKFITLTSQQPTLFILGDGQNAYNQADVSDHFKVRYQAHPNYKDRIDHRIPGKVNVSVHIRRSREEDRYSSELREPTSEASRSRYLPMQYFLDLARIIEDVLGSERVHFNVYSQGDTDAFSCFMQLESCRLYIDTDPLDTFHCLTLSDVLITSPSSFSFNAGMICDGLKIAHYPWWHDIPKEAGWLRIHKQPIEHENEIRTELMKLADL